MGAEGAIALGVSLTIPGACPRLTKFNISNNTVGDQGMIDENPIIGFSMSIKDPSFPALKKLNLSCKCVSFDNLTLSLSLTPLHFRGLLHSLPLAFPTQSVRNRRRGNCSFVDCVNGTKNMPISH